MTYEMQADERALLLAVHDGKFPRHAGAELGMSTERIDELCEKWDDMNWYEYGVTLDLGWLRPMGVEVAEKL